MSYKPIALDRLCVNRANDRHGELENETAAIAWLFSNHHAQMRKLPRDIPMAPASLFMMAIGARRALNCLPRPNAPRARSYRRSSAISESNGKAPFQRKSSVG